MTWPHLLERVTVIDVLDSGACPDGVLDFVRTHNVIAADSTDGRGNEYTARAACRDGYGSGSGYGSSDGDGDGDGDGYGSGYGSGDGYGYGHGEPTLLGSPKT